MIVLRPRSLIELLSTATPVDLDRAHHPTNSHHEQGIALWDHLIDGHGASFFSSKYQERQRAAAGSDVRRFELTSLDSSLKDV
jgi:hypothetical protein